MCASCVKHNRSTIGNTGSKCVPKVLIVVEENVVAVPKLREVPETVPTIAVP